MHLAGLNTIIYGMSYDRNEITEAMYDHLQPMWKFRDKQPVPENYIHILLGHGGDEAHIPINMAKLRKAGFDYVALGHIHKPWLDENHAIAYAGALEPIDRNDEGPHGFIRGEINEERTTFEFVPFACRSYETLELTVEPEMTMQQLAMSASAMMAEKGRDNMFKIVINGFRDPDMEPDERIFEKYGRILSVTDNSIPDFDFQKIYDENRDNIIGMYIKQITEMEISETLKAKALCYGMKALYQIK